MSMLLVQSSVEVVMLEEVVEAICRVAKRWDSPSG